jgi:hypothetical protein
MKAKFLTRLKDFFLGEIRPGRIVWIELKYIKYVGPVKVTYCHSFRMAVGVLLPLRIMHYQGINHWRGNKIEVWEDEIKYIIS